MLQLITGGSGCGKTYYTRQRLCELAREGKIPILIVPEQYSFESERVMLSMLGAKDAHRVRVYSFTRLAEEVARKAGGFAGRRLDDCGRVAAMGLVLSKLSGHLSYYKGKRSSHFIEHLLDAVKEFKLCAINPAELYGIAMKTNGRLREKLSELALIYGAYDAVTAQVSPQKGESLYDRLLEKGVYDDLPSQPTLDPMDDLERLYEQLGEIKFFEGTYVFVDSFRGYTGQELRVLSRIMRQAELCAVTVALEHGSATDEESGLFATAHRTADQLRKLAQDSDCGMLPEVTFSRRYRFVSDPLEIVESSVFRREEDRRVFDEPTDCVTLYEASDRYDELEFCARECRRLVREEGYRCRDIAIIARGDDTYASIAADALGQQGLPCFADLRSDVSGSALMRFVLAALETARSGLRTSDMLRCLKTGMIDGISPTDIAQTENYCFIWNVPAGGWDQSFDQHPDGMGARVSEDSEARLAQINAVRERMVSIILPLSAALRSERADRMCTAVYELVESSGTAACLERLSEQLSATEAAELPQLWELLVSVLEQLHGILGSSACRADEFISFLTLMIKRADVGHIPHGLDEITFGGADRLRVSSPRAVFVVGALEGEFPAVPGSAGVFTDEERRRLRDELGVQVADTADAKLLEERLLVYNALSMAAERLYITWPGAVGGELSRPSELVTEVLACVPEAKRLKCGSLPEPESVGSAGAAFELYARCLGQDNPITASLGEALSRRDEWIDRVRAVEEAHRGDAPSPLGADGARALFGDELLLSASRAETYHQCRYRFFCRYGLAIQPRRKAELDGMEYGTVAHYVLEHIFSDVTDISTLAVDPAHVSRRISALIERFLKEELGGEKGKTEGFLYRLRAMCGSLAALVINLAEELSGSEFKPMEYELRIGENAPVKPRPLGVDGGITGRLVGSIDRVDRCVVGDREYLRVIDYKTGKKVFRLSDVLAGLNMQMIIYLDELCASRAKAHPAGLLYCPAFSGYSDGERDISDSKLASKREKALMRKGIVVESPENLPEGRPAEDSDLPVSRAMEGDLGGRFIPVTLTKSKPNAGMLSSQAKSALVDSEQFELIGRYVRHTLNKMLCTVGEGQFPPDPVDTGFPLCESCDYYPVCRYSGEVRNIDKLTTAEALEVMAERLSDGGEEQ